MITEFQPPYRWLSNFTPCTIMTFGETFASVEHAYQAAKSADPESRRQFIGITAGRAKRLGRKLPIRSDWYLIKLEVMRDLTRRKYETPELRDLLLATGDTHIIEGNTWGDTFWGVCGGRGLNHLGRIIMDTRGEIQNAPLPAPTHWSE